MTLAGGYLSPFRAYRDVHTHRRDAQPGDAIVSLAPDDALPARGCCSVGLHPWHTADMSGEALAAALVFVERKASDPRVVAIGEAGIDNRRGASPPVQERIFLEHVRISEAAAKPLIVHAVGSLQRLIELRRECRPAQPWLVHGYRGKAQMARQLVAHGFELSFGEHFNAEALAATPAAVRHAETDDSALTIDAIEALHSVALAAAERK
ncbi:MAG: TatD family hydrolase [Muribaculaceae bacterium]